MNEQIVLLCEHHRSDIVFFRYEWPREPAAPALLVLESGAEGLAFLRRCVQTYRTGPNFVICEMDLPDCSGLEILRLIKSTPELLDIPVIMMGAALEEGIEREAFEIGALDCWRKPVAPEQLRQLFALMMNPER